MSLKASLIIRITVDEQRQPSDVGTKLATQNGQTVYEGQLITMAGVSWYVTCILHTQKQMYFFKGRSVHVVATPALQ